MTELAILLAALLAPAIGFFAITWADKRFKLFRGIEDNGE